MIRLPDHVVHLPARPWEGLDISLDYGCARPRTYSPLGLVYGAEVVTHVDDLSARLAVPEESLNLLHDAVLGAHFSLPDQECSAHPRNRKRNRSIADDVVEGEWTCRR